jgi:hypothetical protein
MHMLGWDRGVTNLAVFDWGRNEPLKLPDPVVSGRRGNHVTNPPAR